MEYGKIKQGTIIHGLRSNQYPNRECSAIIITAECDIAQCKVSKFYYLSAMDVRTWMDTDGLDYTTANLQLAKFKTFINNFSGKIPELKQYQNVAVVDLDKIESDIRNLPDPIDTSPALKELSKIKMYRAQTKDVLGNLKRVINGDLTNYFFLPYNTYTAKNQKELKPKDFCEGLVVNLLDIGFFDSATVSMIERQDMDFAKLSETDREQYGKQFFLEKSGDMIFPEEAIKPPYRELLMQSFSFAFIRIGVDFNSTNAKNYWDKEFPNTEMP